MNLHVDRVIECVKKIVDNNRCAVCDKADGDRVRYTCGHTACNDCVISTEDCLICLTPPPASASAKPDNVYTQRAKNATSLLRSCQDLFHIDVHKHHRLSEQLRIEKELFPQCIQAPMKYENKKRSFNSSKTKENRRSSYFPGEGVSSIEENKMENTVTYVQQWLNNNRGNLSRKPFADLNVNHQSHKNIAKLKDLKTVTNENKPDCVEKRKRSHFKTNIKNECSKSRKITSIHSTNNYIKKTKIEFDQSDDINKYCEMQQNNNDESGIVIDDEPILIDDSQDTGNDKDRNACLAVLEADKYNEIESTSIRLECRDDINIAEKSLSPKVPFYKKSYLLETCKYCNNESIVKSQPKEVKITIESNSFITTVNIINAAENNTGISRKAVAVQTSISEVIQTNNDFNMVDTNVTELDIECKMEIPIQSDAYVVQSEDLFTDECKNILKKTGLVIEESDSDVDIEYSGPIHVTADIHRSCEEIKSGVLAEVVDQQAHCARLRRGPRGHTPNSTDSSEKENYNPNRIKRDRIRKKNKPKK